MATTVSAATMTVTVTESITLNGTQQGSTNTLSVASIKEVFKRIVRCPASNTTTLAVFNSTVHGAAGAIDLEDAKYIRITNKDDTNELELAMVAGSTNYTIALRAGESHVLGTPDNLMLVDDDSGTPSFGVMIDLASIQANPGGNVIDVEVFIAST